MTRLDLLNDFRRINRHLDPDRPAKLGFERRHIERPGATRRGLGHTGGLAFFPVGAPAVKIAFARDGGRVTQLTVADPDVFITARRES